MKHQPFSCRGDSLNTHTRRIWLRRFLAAATGASLSGWLPLLAAGARSNPSRRRACILLWMSGGPSQLDTFDLKPQHENGGGARAIETSVSGVRISENLPQLAKLADHFAIVRSMSTQEGDHARGTYLMRTGYRPFGPIHYPSIGALYSKELADNDGELPDFISVSPYRVLNQQAYGSGFLGPRHAPLVVGENSRGAPAQADRFGSSLEVANLSLSGGVDIARHDARLDLMSGVDEGFLAHRPDVAATSHRTAYRKAVQMMRSKSIEAFNLEQESDQLRERYGKHQFGQGCLLARRLVERGVPFVEVSLNGSTQNGGFGWDTHRDNQEQVRRLNEILDPAWSTLMTDLGDRGLLESTTIVWMGEFGRTPKVNRSAGRDHYPKAWTTVLAGGGIRGGQVIGRTSDDGTEIIDRPVSVQDLLATVAGALGLDPNRQNVSNVGRPISVVDPEARRIEEALI